MLKSIFLAICSILVIAFPQRSMSPADSESQVKFAIKNFGLTVNGSFKGLEGSVIFDPTDLKKSNMNVSVLASTLNTGINTRDNHLKKKDYFDILNYPKITIISKSITVGPSLGTYIMTGTLHLKGSKKDISIPFTATDINPGYKFTGSFQINRRDFGIGGSSISLSDNLTLYLSIITK
jgi:polyisoprenoid-binding protein YceI